MKILFVTTGSQATIYAVGPVVTAAQNAGHEVLVACHEPWMEAVEALGVPSVSYMSKPIRHFMVAGRPGSSDASSRDLAEDEMLVVGRGFARMASAGLDMLLDLAGDWPPDLVIGGTMSYAAGLLATQLKVPYVRHMEYIQVPIADIDSAAEEELRPELERLGLAGLPAPALFIDVTPPCLRSSPIPDLQPMRWIPRNGQRRLERWMFARTNGTPRVLITSGTHFRMLPATAMRHLVDELVRMGAEVLIAATEEVAAELGTRLGDVHIGWIPLDVVAPTCDLAVHHGGATTAMTIMAAGVPHLIVPPNTHTKAIAQALSGVGAAITVTPARHGPDLALAEALASGCREILAGPRYARQARDLAAEIAALPAPPEVVHTLENLAGG